MTTFEKARLFIYRNARPLDLARWQYHFENGSQEAVLNALSAYQNADGGFGHALEADSFNPNSAPIQTWAAICILDEIGCEDASHPIIQGILRYLESGADFDSRRRQWLNTVPSNNDFPCAVWWNYDDSDNSFRYNPTAALVGFIVRFADKDGKLYSLGCEIAKEAFDWYMESIPLEESHIAKCFVQLYEYLNRANSDIADMELFRTKITEQVALNICKDTSKWNKEYVTLPSNFIMSKDSIFRDGNEELISEECRLIKECQQSDGSYNIPWLWYNDHKEYEIAANWWKSDFCIRYMRFLREFDSI